MPWECGFATHTDSYLSEPLKGSNWDNVRRKQPIVGGHARKPPTH